MQTFKKITGRTKFIALIGDPLTHARSPELVNALLIKEGIYGDVIFIPFAVEASGLSAVILALKQLENFIGAIITMPHKQAIVQLLDKVSSLGQAIGAVNVIRREKDGTLIGDNFDGEGFVAGLLQAGHQIADQKFLLIGAGGAAAAIACSLALHGAGLIDFQNRTPVKAQHIVERIKSIKPQFNTASFASIPHYDILINATSLGMKSEDGLPVSEDWIDRADVIAEVVVTSDLTPLLKLARDKGKATHLGLPMLTSQLALFLKFVGLMS